MDVYIVFSTHGCVTRHNGLDAFLVRTPLHVYTVHTGGDTPSGVCHSYREETKRLSPHGFFLRST